MVDLLTDIQKLYRRMRVSVQVDGRPAHVAKYLETGLCRMRWLALPAIALQLANFVLAVCGLNRFAGSPRVGQWLWLTLDDVVPMIALVALLVIARNVISIAAARRIIILTTLVIIIPNAVAVGLAGLEQSVMTVLTLSLLVSLIIAPLSALGLVSIGVGTISLAAVIAAVVLRRDPAASMADLLVLWFPSAIAAFGITMNLWYARNYRSMWKAERLLVRRSNEIQREQRRIERLLTSALPKPVADELQQTSRFRSRIAEVCVIAVDVCGFSKHCVEMPAQMVVEELQRFFRGFERCCQKYKIEPLRAQGDGVIAIGGLWPEAHGHQRQPVIDAVLAALEFRRLLSTDDAPVDPHGEAAAANLWSARIGIHIGPVVMGVIDGVRLSFDVWGDTVNMAARLEQGACRNSIMLSERALWATRGLFDHGPIGPLQVKDSHLPAVAEVFGIAGPYRTSAGEPNAAFWEVYHAAQFAPIRPPVNGSAAVDGVPVSYRLPGSA